MNNIQILFGSEGIKQAYERGLKTAHLDIQCLSTNYESIIGDWFDTDYAARLYSGQIQTREIVRDNRENREYALSKEGANQVRFAREMSETDVLIGDSFVILVSYDQKTPTAIVLEDSELVVGLKSMFEARWQNAEK